MLPVIQFAPVRGVTTPWFYSIFSNNFDGISHAITPFVPLGNPEKQAKRIRNDAKAISSCRFAIVPQLLAQSSSEFIQTALFFKEAGYGTINWNLGCPYPTVTNRGRGAGLLPFPEKIVSILKDVTDALQINISIKTRLGLTTADDLGRLLPLLCELPLDEIIIHGRTARQMYEGDQHWEALDACVQKSPHPVVLNGDITSVDSFLHMCQRYPGISRFMIGRGLLRDPYLAARISGLPVPAGAERQKQLHQFHNAVFLHYRNTLSGTAHRLQKMKEYWVYFASWFEEDAKVFKQIKKIRTESDYDALVAQLFENAALSNE
ncbi:MAG: tRNA-dihydrouridine synthase family protein [Deltaproteobacteria bacterium]|nr:tRNA-dihydrouridine synthase family protein [Deltaproteobacteria bacterium]